jgi:hypothetical protein
MTYYALPSWTANGGCTKILSIEKNGFFGEGRHCDSVKMRVRRDIVLSGNDHGPLPIRWSRDGRATPDLRVQSVQRQPDGHHEMRGLWAYGRYF